MSAGFWERPGHTETARGLALFLSCHQTLRGRLGLGRCHAQNLPKCPALSRFAWPLPPEATLRKSGCS